MLARIKRRVNKIATERFAKHLVRRTSPRPMISFTFDDFPKSALTLGGRILAQSGCAGTYYAAMGLMGTTTAVGPIFDWTDLDALLSQGHELACHTLDHSSCLSVPSTEFLRGCGENRERAAALLPGQQLRNFSFPFGDVSLATKQKLTSAYTTCRSIEPGLNLDPVDFGFLRANRMYSELPIEPLEMLIRANVQRAGWLVFYTHDIARNPSPYGCTPEYLERLVRCSLDSGAEVLTVHEAASRFCLATAAAPATRNSESEWARSHQSN